MNILHLITLGAAAFNVVRKVLGKRDLAVNIYGDRISSIDSYKLYRKYHINMKRKFLAVVMGDKILYSFLTVYVPDVKVRGKGLLDEKFYTWWEIQIPSTVPGGRYEYGQKIEDWGNEQIVDGRLGKNVRVELFDRIPAHAKEKVKEIRKGGGGYVKMAIRDIYSIPYFAKTHGYPSSFVYGVMKDFAVGLYRRMTIDGLYPPDVFV